MCRAHQSSLDDVNDKTTHFEDSSGAGGLSVQLYSVSRVHVLPYTLAAQSLSTRLLVAKASKDIGQRRRQTVKDSGLCFLRFLDLPWPFDVTSCF